jgi:hypothetical protein
LKNDTAGEDEDRDSSSDNNSANLQETTPSSTHEQPTKKQRTNLEEDQPVEFQDSDSSSDSTSTSSNLQEKTPRFTNRRPLPWEKKKTRLSTPRQHLGQGLRTPQGDGQKSRAQRKIMGLSSSSDNGTEEENVVVPAAEEKGNDSVVVPDAEEKGNDSVSVRSSRSQPKEQKQPRQIAT